MVPYILCARFKIFLPSSPERKHPCTRSLFSWYVIHKLDISAFDFPSIKSIFIISSSFRGPAKLNPLKLLVLSCLNTEKHFDPPLLAGMKRSSDISIIGMQRWRSEQLLRAGLLVVAVCGVLFYAS
jgi:hypothetical protein